MKELTIGANDAVNISRCELHVNVLIEDAFAKLNGEV